MKYLAIVGTSHLSEVEEMDARKRIIWAIQEYGHNELRPLECIKNDLTVISGGAKGIDTLVEQICKEQQINFVKVSPVKQTWNYFKIRNIKIAEMADKVISISTTKKTINCYHCNNQVWEHEKTAGCYTMHYAKHLNKSTELILV